LGRPPIQKQNNSNSKPTNNKPKQPTINTKTNKNHNNQLTNKKPEQQTKLSNKLFNQIIYQENTSRN